MANPEHLDRLLQGMWAWDQWRNDNPGIKPNLSIADLRDVDLCDADLANADLRGANLCGADLSDADLTNADLRDADLRSADLINADLTNADLRDADLRGADLINADLTNANLRDADLRGADLINADLTNADLSNAILRDKGIGFSSIRSANLSGAILYGAILYGVDLSSTDLFDANLRGANLSGWDLSDTNFSGKDLRGAILSDAILSDADLTNADLREAALHGVDLTNADFCGADLRGAILRHVINIDNANLDGANLRNIDLRDTDLSGTDLSGKDLSNVNLSGANLNRVQALGTNFNAAILTGACIGDWNINSHTNLQDVVCEYIFTRYDYDAEQFTDRLPHDPNQIFAPGEFTKRYQIVLETVDLFFNDGIDWRAFLDSLQDLKTQYGNDLNIQGIEKKAGGSFLVRLEVPSDADKGTIERAAKELYETKLQILEAKYHAELQAKEREIEIYKQKSADILELAKLAASRPITVEAKAVAENQSSSESYSNTFNNSPIGNFANKMQDQASQQTNQSIGANLNEITTLIHSLRNIAESFPEAQRTEAIDHLEDLETDLKQPPEKRKISRIKAALLTLVGIATAIGGTVTSTNEFVGQVQELSDKLGIPLAIEQVQPPSQNAIDVEAIGSEYP
jgi:uncharacterized protein YjbI with pentapeptide repeats